MAFDESGGDSWQEPGLELLLRLTEALCRLGCTQDASGRAQFAALLGEQLQHHIDLRGIRLREDVVTMVRAALSVPGGERVLVWVVDVCEGAEAAADLKAVVGSVIAPPAPTAPAGPLSGYDESTAHALLQAVGDEIPAVRLRDDLVAELHGVDLPTGRTVEQLFTYAVELNVQPDGLPPAVLLIDHASRLVPVADRRKALSDWVEAWARHAGLLEALEHRRARRATGAYDPEIPRCLVVAVEPARDGSGEIVVRPWLNGVPGRWQPHPGEPVTTTLDRLGPAVEGVLRRGARLWAIEPVSTHEDQDQPPPYVEFVLPYDLLNHDVGRLRLSSGGGSPLPLGLKYGVHLRSLERMRTDDVLVRAQWRERWRTLREHGIAVQSWDESDARGFEDWQVSLAEERRRTAVVLDAPVKPPALEALKAAIAEGIGLAVWDRRGVFHDERREVVTAVFASVPTPSQVPMAIHRLRRKAEANPHGPLLLGRHIAFLWDDPTRLVDMQPTDTGDPASEEASA
ncbi:hypothetical protein ABZ078_22880 [Streptomyces sp. NPDC006385]|uniref:VMAP-C domain-containing protein n=1 Tax=Streptomyces sp. NPDC006385 TaxID=3156761 RepID=UPI0033B52B64